jgi:hypothetical protein
MTQLMASMDCRTFRKHHLAYLDDTLSGDQTAAAQRHILSCDGCAAHDTLVRRSLMLARSMPTIEPSVAFQERLQARLAQCRQERTSNPATDAADDARFDDALFAPPPHGAPLHGAARALWRSPRTLAAIAAGAVLGTMIWRGVHVPSAPMVSMQPVMISPPAPVRAANAQYVSPALLQAMATGNPVWPATVIIDEAPTGFVNSGFVNVEYSMQMDGR